MWLQLQLLHHAWAVLRINHVHALRRGLPIVLAGIHGERRVGSVRVNLRERWGCTVGAVRGLRLMVCAHGLSCSDRQTLARTLALQGEARASVRSSGALALTQTCARAAACLWAEALWCAHGATLLLRGAGACMCVYVFSAYARWDGHSLTGEFVR